MRLNADFLVSRLGSHGEIDSFVRAFKSMDNLAAALVFDDPHISTKEASSIRE